MSKFLKGLFYDSEDTEEETEVQAPAVGTQPAPAATPVATAVLSGTVNEEMANMLMSAIQEANLDGFDYIEFRDSVLNMAGTPMTEQQKYQAVFTTAKAMGLTIQTLTDAVDHYQAVIDSKKDSFLASVESQVAAEVTSREEKKLSKENLIQEAADKIKELNDFITASQQENVELANEINQHKLNIGNTTAAFEATYGMVSGKLAEDKNKIQTYLGGEA
jgi:hypothetical protein